MVGFVIYAINFKINREILINKKRDFINYEIPFFVNLYYKSYPLIQLKINASVGETCGAITFSNCPFSLIKYF